MKKTAKHPEDMSAAELAEATRKFNEPFMYERARPMTAAERAEEKTLRRGRPKIGKGARKISISLEWDLLKKADAFAKKRGVNRSQLITRFVVDGLQRRAS
jgi:hypothetical protein